MSTSFKLLLLFFMFACAAYAFDFDWSLILHSGHTQFSYSNALLVILVFGITFFLSSFRLYLIYKQFNLQASFQAIITANLYGQLSGILPVFGTALGQSKSLSQSSNIRTSTSTFIFFADKIIMAGCGLLISLVAAYLLFGKNYPAKNLEGNVNLVEFILALLFTTIIIFWKGINSKDKIKIFQYLNKNNFYFIIKLSLISILTWCLSSTCFALLIKSIDSNHAYSQLLYSSLIVSFIASMPVSVNGWGVREFAAISFFSLLGVSKEVSLYAAVSIGLFSTLSLILIAMFSSLYSILWTRYEAIKS